ncbi:hypothetical protein IV203_033904 [Nitzschia inconspicua]|uniref:Uncharacterized protein n=1 Tax=Nitzschia inconspicua TaxID=303405 RepID=A0A9K3Q7E4_9STRA|nr:hypothetical protein IV203_033904 [Nitzschia inconspicua]
MVSFSTYSVRNNLPTRTFIVFLLGIAVGSNFSLIFHQTKIILDLLRTDHSNKQDTPAESRHPMMVLTKDSSKANAMIPVFSSLESKAESSKTFTKRKKGEEKNSLLLATNVSTDSKIAKQSSENECQLTKSQHQMSLQMANFSSHPGSPSFQKMLRILQQSRYYKICPDFPVFDDNIRNYARMLEGYGLRPAPSNETLLDPSITLHLTRVSIKLPICHTMDCNNIPRILTQSEQMSGVGMGFLNELEECQNSPLCIILEFSDFNYQLMTQRSLKDSVMLLPIMHQARLGDAKEEQIVPMKQRSIDVVFYGYMQSSRRKQIWSQLNTTKIHFLFSTDYSLSEMAQTYSNSKICLIVHSHTQSALETHRLSEMSRFGCIPLIETVFDTLQLEYYQECGDVTFADFDSLVNTSMEMLSKIQRTPSRVLAEQMRKRIQWWRSGIIWEALLNEIFAGYPKTGYPQNTTKDKKQ